MTGRARELAPRSDGPYRLAVPMSEETLAAVDDYAGRWECTRTEAARALLAWAGDQWVKERRRKH